MLAHACSQDQQKEGTGTDGRQHTASKRMVTGLLEQGQSRVGAWVVAGLVTHHSRVGYTVAVIASVVAVGVRHSVTHGKLQQ